MPLSACQAAWERQEAEAKACAEEKETNRKAEQEREDAEKAMIQVRPGNCCLPQKVGGSLSTHKEDDTCQ